MQEPEQSRTNEERTQATRAALLASARKHFVEKGFAGTSTPEIVRSAGMTRGALYHHFDDKRGLFHAVVKEEHRAVAQDINDSADTGASAQESLVKGSEAYLRAMTVPGRTRLLLIEAPSVLGGTAADELDDSAATLLEGLKAAKDLSGSGIALPVLAKLLSAAFDRAALEIEAGWDAAETRAAMIFVVERIIGTTNK